MRLPWGKIAQYAIPVATALLGATGGYVGSKTISSPVEPQIASNGASNPPVINITPVDFSKLKLPDCKLTCPSIPPCPKLIVEGINR